MRSKVQWRMRVLIMTMGWALLALGGAPAGAAGPGATTIASGVDHTCAVRTDHTVWCWGDDSAGQLGDGTTGDADGLRSTPVRVKRGSSALTGVRKIAAGAMHSCALRSDGSVWCWGDDSDGQLGDGTTGDPATFMRTTAVRVRQGTGHLANVVAIAAGAGHSCALKRDGSVWCWGSGSFGQLGDGASGVGHMRTKATRVRTGSGILSRVTGIAAGLTHTCARRSDGSAWCWGRGSQGELGDGASGAGHFRALASRVRRGSGHLTRVSDLAGGGSHTCARRTDGSAWCWGSAEQGQLGDGTTGSQSAHVRSKPVRVARGEGDLTGVAGVGAGGLHTCARRTDGSAWCWGYAEQGQLGDGTTGDATTHHRLKPVRVRRATSAFTSVRKLDGGIGHTCALRIDGTVWCWGSNSRGQAGRGTWDEDPHPYPRKVLFP